MLLLNRDITRKMKVDKALPELKKDMKFETKGKKEYKVEAIINSAIYS